MLSITKLAKNRITLEHNGKKLRIEVSDKETGFRLYFDPNATIQMPRDLVIGKRKMVIG